MKSLKIIKVDDTVVVYLESGVMLQNNNLSEDEFQKLLDAESEDEITSIMIPKHKEIMQERNVMLELQTRVASSKLLVQKGDSIYWEDISQLSMPKELVLAILEAEENGDEDKLLAYQNFWTLMCLNPDSRCRQNLFWFLNKYGMKISKSGMFVAYRNAVKLNNTNSNSTTYPKDLIEDVKILYSILRNQKKSTSKAYLKKENKEWVITKEETPYNLRKLHDEFKAFDFDYNKINQGKDMVFTDKHTHTTRIKIGELVSMKREDTDTCQENSCSRGLHLGGKSWLKQYYYGDTGLVCLCNPAKVVAVPPIDNYGKLRTCEYLPIAIAKFDSDGDVIEYNLEDGFDNSYIPKLIYDGIQSTEEIATYSIEIPSIPELNKTNITEKLLNIASQSIKNKVL